MKVLGAVLATFALVAAMEQPAHAQVHWDASAAAGPILRTGRTDTSLGIATDLAGHVALLPLLRAGLALHGEVQPGAGPVLFEGAAARVKLYSPWPAPSTRLYLHVGAGVTLVQAKDPTDTFRSRVTGDLPFGAGFHTRVWGQWAFLAELGVRYGFAHVGNGTGVVGTGLVLGVFYDG